MMDQPQKHPIHFCLTGGRAIFLDLRHDRYFALPSGLNAAFARLVEDRCMGIITRANLAALGKSAETDCPSITHVAVSEITFPQMPASDRVQCRIERKRKRGLVALAVIFIGLAKLAICLLPLRLILAVIKAGQRKTAGQCDHDRMDRIAAAFRRTGLLIGNEGNCLPLTLAFVGVCRFLGQYPDFIIGVRVNPFSAHCWSQSGSVVLNDALDRVRLYQPLVIL